MLAMALILTSSRGDAMNDPAGAPGAPPDGLMSARAVQDGAATSCSSGCNAGVGGLQTARKAAAKLGNPLPSSEGGPWSAVIFCSGIVSRCTKARGFLTAPNVP